MNITGLKNLAAMLVVGGACAFALAALAPARAESPASVPPSDARDDAPESASQAKQDDVRLDRYRFRNGDVIDHLRLHYANLGRCAIPEAIAAPRRETRRSRTAWSAEASTP